MNNQNNSKLLGCLTIVFAFVLASILFALVEQFIPINSITLFIICYFITLRFLHYFTNKKISKSQNVWLVLLLCIALGSRFFSNKNYFSPNKSDSNLIATKYIYHNNDSTEVFSHTRKWKDYIGKSYVGEFNIRKQDYYDSKEFHQNLNLPKSNSWKDLYKKITVADKPKLDLILKEFYYLHKGHQLNQREFAEMVVSFVQDIPYALVFQQECLEANAYKDEIRQTLEECPDCCIGNQKYGIQTPVEFLSNLKGDCDTRTMLIFTILKHFGYDVAILNSDFYLHSVIGIALPATGTYKSHYGKRYYFWETTNKYYKIGEIPKHLSNTAHWYVVLTNNS